MASNSAKNSADIDAQIPYHNEMEHISNGAGDFTKADHHRMMQEIYKAIREEEQVHKTSYQLSHEDNKVACTITEKEILA